jgi:hypothetical protein
MSEQDNLPRWTGKPGRYEVWFLTMSDGSAGYWIRYTLLAPTRASGTSPGATSGEARLWFARFDRKDPAETFGINRSVPIDRFSAEQGDFEIRVEGALMRSGHVQGTLTGGGREVSWLLDFDTGGPTYRLLPDALYRGGLAPTKPYAPNVATAFTGRITVDGHAVPVTAMPGQQGHLVGSKHAERWAWAHCGAFDGEDAVFQAIAAQGKRGPITTPVTTFAGLRWQGKWIRLSGTSRKRPWWLGGWRIDLADRRFRLTGRVAGDPGHMVQARYTDPDGTPRFCHNTEVASSRLVLFERRRGGFEEVAVLSSEGTTHAEWAGRTPAPGEFKPHLWIDGE